MARRKTTITKTEGRTVTADERDWESCVEPNCHNRVARFVRGDFYCRKHAVALALFVDLGGSETVGKTASGRDSSGVVHIARAGAVSGFVARCHDDWSVDGVRVDTPHSNYWDTVADVLCSRCFGPRDAI